MGNFVAELKKFKTTTIQVVGVLSGSNPALNPVSDPLPE